MLVLVIIVKQFHSPLEPMLILSRNPFHKSKDLLFGEKSITIIITNPPCPETTITTYPMTPRTMGGMCVENHPEARLSSPHNLPYIKPTEFTYDTLPQLVPVIKVNGGGFQEHKMRKPPFHKIHCRNNFVGIPRFVHEEFIVGSRGWGSVSLLLCQDGLLPLLGLEDTSVVMMWEHSCGAFGGVCLPDRLDQLPAFSPADDVIRNAFAGVWIEFIECMCDPP